MSNNMFSQRITFRISESLVRRLKKNAGVTGALRICIGARSPRELSERSRDFKLSLRLGEGGRLDRLCGERAI